MLFDTDSGGAKYEIQKSLRFRASALAYLSRTYSSLPTLGTKQTISVWAKRGVIGSAYSLLASGYDGSSPNAFYIGFVSDAIQVQFGGSGANALNTSAVYRDPAAWYHIVLSIDTTHVTASERVRLFVSGERVVSFSSATYPAQNAVCQFGIANPNNKIGAVYTGTNYWYDGYLSEINFIDGQAFDPSYFGQVSAETGAWIPKGYTGTYGTNGFYLPVNDGSTLANLTADRSGNGNNWTANNFSLTSGVTYDWMDDTPTNNFAVLNPISKSSYATVVDGNLYGRGVSSTDAANMYGSIAFSTGLWYAEFTVSAVNSSFYPAIGVIRTSLSTLGNNGAGGVAGYQSGDISYLSGGNKLTGGSNTAYGASFAAGDVISVAVDATNGAVYFAKNGVWQNSGVPTSGVSKTGAALTWSGGVEYYLSLSGYYGSGVDAGAYANFGQRPFAYSPPAGFKALCTKNLPTPSILNPKKHFDVKTYTGTGAVRSITGLEFTPDLVWMKSRGSAQQHMLQDSVRGATRFLSSNLTAAEAINVNTLTSFDSGGFTLGSEPAVNQSATAFAGWTWKAGGAPVTNNAGSIQSQVSANPQAGFSIVTYTGAGGNVAASWGHGLSNVPALIITKDRDTAVTGTSHWTTWHSALGLNGYVNLSTTDAKGVAANRWGGVLPTSAVVTVGGDASNVTNEAGHRYIAYCFAEIPGYSKIGSYTGNGSVDGPFVYCGFRPRYVLIKRVDVVAQWLVFDTARSSDNPVDDYLVPNASDLEQPNNADRRLDLLSNGFKLRAGATALEFNTSGGSYIFYAVAEQPFQFANAR